MINFLRRFLGMDLALTEIDTLRARRNELYDQIKELQETHRDELALKDLEIQRLTDLMLMEHGVIIRDNESRATTNEKPQPIGRRPAWSNVRKRFEDADAKMAQTIAKDQVDKVRDYWQKKDQKANEEIA